MAILALVTLPIINYFTYSGLRTADGRDKQSATVVAENVLDELNSYDNFEQIENIASSGAVDAASWTVVPDPSNPTKFTYTDLTKKVQLDMITKRKFILHTRIIRRQTEKRMIQDMIPIR